jgi:hypothetical protein
MEDENEYPDYKAMSNRWDFIARKGYQLYEKDKIFRFASYNIPNLLMLEDRTYTSSTLYGFPICKFPVKNPSYDENGYGYGYENNQSCIIPKHGESDPAEKWVIPTPYEQEDAILSISGSGGQVARTYTLGFGPKYHVTGPNSFYEPAFVAMDHALALARKHFVRLIIPLVNNHDGGDYTGLGNFGDYLSICQFRNLTASQFYKHPLLRQDLKDIITFLLNRVNTVNGIVYKNDPTILAWQLGNELGGWDDTPPPVDWSLDIAYHIKSIAPNTLVMDGTMGGLDCTRRYPQQTLESHLIDIFSLHYYYGDSDISRISRDSKHITKFGKVMIIGEFGFAYKYGKNIYKTVLKNKLVSGALAWSLRFHSRDGGFYIHNEDGGYSSFHVPGFESSEGFGVDDLKFAKMVRKFGYEFQGVDPAKVAFLKPKRPEGVVCDPYKLKFAGSAWAAKYQLYRREYGSDKWDYITDVYDSVKAGGFYYCDQSAVPGRLYYYKVVPVSVDSIPALENFLEIGPISIN